MMTILTSAGVVDSSRMHCQSAILAGRTRSIATARHSRSTPIAGELRAASTPCAYRHLQWKMPDADGTHKSLRINNAVAA
jgi:hypothetical protein